MTEVHTIDCEYLQPRFAAAYLLVNQGKAAFVDNNTSHSVPLLLSELARQGLVPEQVEYVIITHVHLDHAGGTAALMKACPNAVLLAHPRALPHMLDPSKLVASAKKVYGEETFTRLYGSIDPVDSSRARSMPDGGEIRLGDGTLRFLHTRGHANHHFCVLELENGEPGAIFTGDSFGLQYPALQLGGRFIFPTTSPTDFDPAEALASVERIAATRAKFAYPTHFGRVEELDEAARQLKGHLEFSGELLERATRSPLSDSELAGFCRAELDRHYRDTVSARHLGFGPAEWDLLKLDLDLNADGIAFVANKRRSKSMISKHGST